LAQLAPLLTPIVAAAAVAVAWGQLRSNRINQRETTAKSIWRDHLRLAIEYPDLAFGKYEEDQKSKYEWFIAHLLWASEEILDFDTNWESNVEVSVGYHRHYYRNHPNFMQQELPLYSAKIQELVHHAVAIRDN
jgi:hypothetical protein